MPEGPEIRRAADALGRVLTDRPLTRIEYRVPRLAQRARKLRGARVTRVYARGKALLIEFDCGLTHYSHNQLYGEWEVARGTPPRNASRTARVVIATATHTSTLFSATQIELLATRDVETHPYIASLGPDALDRTTTPSMIRRRLDDPRFRGRSLASLLLDQRFVAGLGNYLRSDILFAAGLRAHWRPRDLDDGARARLGRAIVALARRSYRTGGVTNEPRRARAARDAGGTFEETRFLVYGREGAPCWVCDTPIVRSNACGRGLFHCAACQPIRQRLPRMAR